MSSKRCREPLPPQQLGKRNWLQRHGKNQKLMLGDKQRTCDRKWEEMDHELLICIMKRYRWYEWRRFDFIICKSWLSAFLDVLFPPGDVLDLRLLDDHTNFRFYEYESTIRRFCHYLKLNLNRRSSNQYTKLIVSECILNWLTYRNIAEMLPSLKSVVFPGKMISNRREFTTRCPKDCKFSYRDNRSYNESYRFISSAMFKYWKNLEDAHCGFHMVCVMGACCKSIRNLTIVGRDIDVIEWLPDSIASAIAEGFPLLDRLSFTSYRLTMTGMSIILEGHKNLSYLDMKHTHCIPEEDMLWWKYPTPLDYSWPKDLSVQIARVQTFLTWDGKSCPNCTHLYSRLLYDSKLFVYKKLAHPPASP